MVIIYLAVTWQKELLNFTGLNLSLSKSVEYHADKATYRMLYMIVYKHSLSYC